jgi:hypothetical protein
MAIKVEGDFKVTFVDNNYTNTIEDNNLHTINFIVDEAADIAGLPNQKEDKGLGYGRVNMGSTAYVIRTGKMYMLNSKREWRMLSR